MTTSFGLVSRFIPIRFAIASAAFLLSYSTVDAKTPGNVKEPKVVMVMIDGIRALEWQGKARDDDGRPVRAEELFPNLTRLKSEGVFFPEMSVSNPVGVSLPAYADIFAGRRQEKILSNEPPKEIFHSFYPTIFQVVKEGLKLDHDGVALHASWENLCPIATTPDANPSQDFYRSCGYSKDKHFKQPLYAPARADADTFIEFSRELPKRHPRLAVVHLVDGDIEGHYEKTIKEKSGVEYGVFNYQKALREDDYYLGRIWRQLQQDPFYKGSTYLIVTTDHGRDNYPDPRQWTDHGHCIREGGAKKLCSGCSRIFTLVVGPGLKKQVSKTPYTHVNLAPTIAALFGLKMPEGAAKAMVEITGK